MQTITHSPAADIFPIKNDVQPIANLNGRFTIIWLQSGILNVLEGSQVTRIGPNRLLCLLPGHTLRLLPDADMEAYAVSVSGDFLMMAGLEKTYPFSWHYGNRNAPRMVLESGNGARKSGIEGMMKLVIRNVDTGCHSRTDMFRGLMHILAVYFCRGGEQQSPEVLFTSYDEQLFRKFMRLLDADYVSRKSVMEYAKALAVTPNCLSDAIKKVSGHTASFHIQHRVITEAKRAAANCRVSMKEVAYQVGFVDLAHFSKFFRAQTGMNFSDYKKMLV